MFFAMARNFRKEWSPKQNHYVWTTGRDKIRISKLNYSGSSEAEAFTTFLTEYSICWKLPLMSIVQIVLLVEARKKRWNINIGVAASTSISRCAILNSGSNLILLAF